MIDIKVHSPILKRMGREEIGTLLRTTRSVLRNALDLTNPIVTISTFEAGLGVAPIMVFVMETTLLSPEVCKDLARQITHQEKLGVERVSVVAYQVAGMVSAGHTYL